jgi:hypothetical protein
LNGEQTATIDTKIFRHLFGAKIVLADLSKNNKPRGVANVSKTKWRKPSDLIDIALNADDTVSLGCVIIMPRYYSHGWTAQNVG